jgi:hypothetical protein
MHALSPTELLRVWEAGSNQIPLQRALTILSAGCPESSSDSLADLRIGQRDTRLLALREMTFGCDITGVTDCPHCGEKVELGLNCSDLLAPLAADPPNELVIQTNGRELRFRLPTSADLLAINNSEQLLERCLLSSGDQLTKDLRGVVGEKMSAADPIGDIHLALNCPGCEHKWTAPFDIVGFLWREISAAARRLLREIHTLASAYGWTETEILSLNPARRRTYLEMANG